MNLVLERVSHPFTPPERLKKHIQANRLEYGAAGREQYPLPSNTIIWKISFDQVEGAGFVWLDEIANAPGSRNILMAVYPEFGGQGLAKTALAQIESYFPDLGIVELRAQVNSNLAETGLRVRNWLWREGFRLSERPSFSRWRDQPEEVVLVKYPGPVHLKKTYESPAN